MTDSYYGYTYTPNSRDDRYVTYSGDQHDLSDDGTTSWGSPDSMTVDILAQNIRRHTGDLESNWRSPEAKPVFLQHVGATLYSFDDWRGRADHNATYLDTVATQLRTSKQAVQRIYTEWVDKFNERTAQAATQRSLWSQMDGDDGAWEDVDFDDWKRQEDRRGAAAHDRTRRRVHGGHVQQGYRFKGR